MLINIQQNSIKYWGIWQNASQSLQYYVILLQLRIKKTNKEIRLTKENRHGLFPKNKSNRSQSSGKLLRCDVIVRKVAIERFSYMQVVPNWGHKEVLACMFFFSLFVFTFICLFVISTVIVYTFISIIVPISIITILITTPIITPHYHYRHIHHYHWYHHYFYHN